MYDPVNATSVIIDPALVSALEMQTYLLIVIAFGLLFFVVNRIGGWILSLSAKF